jgi:ubiquinone/menaquinone biosynthesis C-methylase UbiE
MIGVTTTKNSGNEWEATAPYAATLTAIANHKSKASGKYYLRYFKSYFINIEESLREIRRVLRPRGKVVMVLQDSHYKDIHIDLVGIIRELASNLGLPSQVLHENRQTAPYSAIHPYRGRYRTSSIATESVILLGPP